MIPIFEKIFQRISYRLVCGKEFALQTATNLAKIMGCWQSVCGTEFAYKTATNIAKIMGCRQPVYGTEFAQQQIWLK